jgi:leucyl aminopeptidase
MEVSATTSAPPESGCDTIAIAIFDGERIVHDVDDGALQGLIDAGEARSNLEKTAVAHAGGLRYVLVGCGAREEFDRERARRAAAAAHGRTRELGARTLCWELPHHVSDEIAAALVDGTLSAALRIDRYRSEPEEDERALERLVVSAHDDVGAAVAAGETLGGAVNAARDLQNAPGNELTPMALAQRASELADELPGLAFEAFGMDGLRERGMGAFAAVAQGSYEEPRLITLCYDGHPAPIGPTLGWVGKAVTFDSGGISLKPGAKMSEMKFDMSGGASVIEAVGAVARLALPVRVLAVVGATENLPSGRSMKPGDIVRASNGTTIEINNTDAEGRLVLADCLAYAVDQGAERLIDLATLTGAIITTFGSTHAGLMGNDENWLAEIEAASAACGEELWRLPLHAEYADLIKGRYADISNVVESRKAGSITAAEFLARFVGEVPWAHLDIAGVAWDRGRAYARKGGTGFGVRLLVELARAVAAEPAPTPGEA